MAAANPTPQPAGPPLFLRKGAERRLRFGHPWVFSNEVDTGRSPFKGFTPGEAVELRNHRGDPLASAYVNPRSLILARTLGPPGTRLDAELLTDRLARALRRRERHFDGAFYRLVYGESDGLPGLIVDRYGEVLVAQMTTAGMEAAREAIVEALREGLSPRAILLKNDTPAREIEGLEGYVEVVHGQIPDTIQYQENGARFEIEPLGGQKTGWYFDHRRNRARALRYAPDARVLDLFCYTGAWGVQCAVAGAREVLGVDTSASGLVQAQQHASLNGVSERMQLERGDAFDVLRALRGANRRFDLIIADPPAFIRRKKDAIRGFEAYRRLNGLAMQLLADGGMLVSASCSYHLTRDKLVEIVARVASGVGRGAAIVEEGHQDVDHPVHPALAESRYLKAMFVEIWDS